MAEAQQTKKAYTPPPPIPPVQEGQTVYVTVLPKRNIIGDIDDTSPKLFATREKAQEDCDTLNKTRHPASQFVIREMRIH